MRVRSLEDIKRVDDNGELHRLRERAGNFSNGNELLSDQIFKKLMAVDLLKRLMEEVKEGRQPQHNITPRKPRSSRISTRREIITNLTDACNGPSRPSSNSGTGSAPTSSKKRGRARDRVIMEEKKSNKRKTLTSRPVLDLEDLRKRGVRLDQPPEDVMAKARELGGTDPMLVITKKFYKTDASTHHSRFNLPLGQMDGRFLTAEEWETVMESESGMQVMLLGPQLLVTTEMTLKKWNLDGGGVIPVLTSNRWSKLLVEYETRYPGVLNVQDVVQIWAFRCNGGTDLWLALVVVDKGRPATAVPAAADASACTCMETMI